MIAALLSIAALECTPATLAQSLDWRVTRAITTTVNVTTTSRVIVPANPNRRCLYIWNNSANSAYITFGPQTDTAAPTAIVATFTSFVMNGVPIYTGTLSARRNAGSGNMVTYECLP